MLKYLIKDSRHETMQANKQVKRLLFLLLAPSARVFKVLRKATIKEPRQIEPKEVVTDLQRLQNQKGRFIPLKSSYGWVGWHSSGSQEVP